jgi:class 3 adenylate cyclase
MMPRMAFDNLKSILNQITTVIHNYGGVVDKTLGDGLLCYFGYRIESDETDTDHPERAVRCAVEIQKLFLENAVAAARSAAPIYPLRIGVNTTSCYLVI